MSILSPLYKFIAHLVVQNKAQRKNFYQGISAVGLKEYLNLKKVVSGEQNEAKNFKYNVSIVAIAKNEGIYFREWIEYHKLIGIEHFYIYNNDTEDNTKEILQPYIDEGLITWIDIHGKKKQAEAYNHCVKNFKQDTKWLCALDLDEFVVLKKHKNINEFMAEFKDCFQVSIRWVFYGSSGHIKQPKGLVIENFKAHAKDCSATPKSIFNPRATIDASPVHYVIGVGHWVDEHHIEYGKAHPSVEVAQINHYFIKSKEEFVHRKAARGSNYDKHIIKDIEETFNQNDINDVTDNLMDDFSQKLKSVINN